jgi:hypothetical protein
MTIKQFTDPHEAMVGCPETHIVRHPATMAKPIVEKRIFIS